MKMKRQETHLKHLEDEMVYTNIPVERNSKPRQTVQYILKTSGRRKDDPALE